MAKLQENFVLDIDRDQEELQVRVSVEASFNVYNDGIGPNIEIDHIVDMDNGSKILKDSELSTKERQQLVAGVIELIDAKYANGEYNDYLNLNRGYYRI